MDNGPPAGNRFVGRQREMAELNAALEDALAGHGRVVMLAGEPGIGKTRTAQELASHAETLGAQVLWGWCYEQEGAPPYWPWVQPIRSYIQRATAVELRTEMGPGAADIAEVISEVRAKLSPLEPPPPLEPEQARFRLFDSIAAFLSNAAQARPLLLVLDDLHWADKPSLLLLQFLAQQLGGCPMLVVGTCRDIEVSRQHPLSETLAQLSRLPVFLRLELKGLDRQDTADFIQSATGVRPRSQMVESVYSHTEGNPFFMSQVVRLLVQEGSLTLGPSPGGRGVAEGRGEGGWEVRIPAGVREAIGQRLNRLSARCNETLAMASAIGRGFDFRLLRALSPQVTEDQLLKVIDEALGAHLIEGLPGGVERYQFSHALVQQTLTEALSASRRVRQHARVGEALEALYGADVEAHAAELAYHFGQAQPLLGRDKLVRYSLLAGERALATHAFEDAVGHIERALTAKGVPLTGLEPAGDAETAALLSGLGRAKTGTAENLQRWQGQASLSRAFDFYVDTGDVARAVAIAEFQLTVLEDTGQRIARALTLVPPDSHEAGRLLSRQIVELGQSEAGYDGAAKAFAQAFEIAQRVNDVALKFESLVAMAHVDAMHLRLRECRERDLQALELAPAADRAAAEAHAHFELANVLFAMGDRAGAEAQAAAMLASAKRSGSRIWITNSIRVNADMASIRGDWAAGRESTSRGLEASPRDAALLASRAILEYQVGDFPQGEAHLQRLIEVVRGITPGAIPLVGSVAPIIVIPMAARIKGSDDRLEFAQASAHALLSYPYAEPIFVQIAAMGVALIAVLLGDTESAREQYAILEPWRGTMVSPQRACGLDLAVDHVLGLLAQDMGDRERAAQHFEDALDFCRKAGYRPELAWTCHDYAEALLQRASPGAGRGGSRTAPTAGDRTKALSLLDEALSISSELGMRPLMERVSALRERVASGPEAAPAYPSGLTQREVEVLRLVASGKTDREIAEQLFISVRTVGNHVSNILNKTNTANRTEAATYAARHGLA